jgi:hypothetical protein
MAYRKGDIVTMGFGPALRVRKYETLKPHAEITRELGDDPEADMLELEKDVERAYGIALLNELGLWEEFHTALESGGLDALIALARDKEKLHAEKTSEEKREDERDGLEAGRNGKRRRKAKKRKKES